MISETLLIDNLKAIEGEIFKYTRRLQTQRLSESELDKIALLKKSTRLAVFSYKSLNDVEHDLQDLYLQKISATGMQPTQKLIETLQSTIVQLDKVLNAAKTSADWKNLFEDLRVELKLQHRCGRDLLYSSELDEEFNNEEISSLLNLNREIYNAGKYAIVSVEEFLQH